VKISTDLQTKFAAETHLTEGQWLWEQQNVEKFLMFPEGTRIPTVSRTQWQLLTPLKTPIKNKASM
jgi:hypothetical protein